MKKNVNLNVTCPNCRQVFSATDSIFSELKSSIQSDLDGQLSIQREQLEQEKEQVQKLWFQLNSEKQKLDELVNSKVKDREGFIRTQIEKQITEEKEEELKLLEESLAKKTKMLADQNKMKRQMMLIQQEAEEKEVEIILKYEERLKEVSQSMNNKNEEIHTLEIGQKNKIISDLKAQLDLAKKKVDQYSGQLIGESAEVQLENQLREAFPQDAISSVPQGVSGADLIMHMKTASGASFGKILIEIKNVANYSNSWIPKLKEDNSKIGTSASALVLVTKALPKSLEGQKFGIIDDVFVTTHSTAREIIILLRHSMLKINQMMLTYKGKETKQQLLFEYLTSPDFKNIYEGVLTQLDNVRANLEMEKKKLSKLWAERGVALDKAIMSTIELFGVLRSHTEGGISEIKSLEILPKAS